MSPTGLRVTGGRLGGRRLRCPSGGLRPTSDRVREAIFARLGELAGARVLDLYAGTGALGAEAISRGAEAVVYVERAPRCLAALRANLEALGIEAASRVIPDDAVRALRRLGRSGERFDLLLLDPPYASDEVRRALEAVAESGVLAEGAMVVVEHGKRQALPAVAGLVVLDARRYGDTVITRLTAARGDEQKGGPSGA